MEIDLIFRLILGGVLPGIIGIEREYRSKEAGFRTHFLVGLGSALVMIISLYGFTQFLGMPGLTIDPTKMPAQVISGIGFIGAGTIILNKNIVKGLTTSAGIWVSAILGLSIGLGLFKISIIATIIAISSLEIVHLFNKEREFKVLAIKFVLDRNLEKIVKEITKIDKRLDLISTAVVKEKDRRFFMAEFRIYKNDEESFSLIRDVLNTNLKVEEIKIDGK